MDRGLSDVLGYVLIFTLILSSVALVTAGGYESLESVRDAERFANAERVFEVLDANVDDHLESGVPSRATEIRLSDAGLAFGDSVAFNVSVAGVGYNRTTTEPLVYTQSGERQIAYTGGATVRTDRGYSLVVDGPPFRFGEETVLTLVTMRGRDDGISGSGRIMVRSRLATESAHAYDSGPYTVTVNVTSDHADAWARWLESETGEDCTVAGSTASCSVQTEALYVRTVALDVYLE